MSAVRRAGQGNKGGGARRARTRVLKKRSLRRDSCACVALRQGWNAVVHRSKARWQGKTRPKDIRMRQGRRWLGLA